MSRFDVVVRPHGSVYVGGYSASSGDSDGDTASDELGLLIPGSALKGALREAALRLVRGAGKGEMLARRLFGAEDEEGLIQVGVLREEPSEARAPTSLRFHVSLERATRQAAPQRLFQNRVSAAGVGLCFRGELTTSDGLDAEELGLLLSAAKLTDQIGGGRGRGLGLVEIEIREGLETQSTKGGLAAPEGASRLWLSFRAVEPLQLAGVKDPGNLTPSKEVVDGSVLRGAIAAALAATEPDRLEGVVGGPSPAIFGDARPGDPTAIPAPLTLNEPKAGGEVVDEALGLCAEALTGLREPSRRDQRRATGSYEHVDGRWRKVPIRRRTITRTARDAASGRGLDSQLYSLEVLDPFLGSGTGARPLQLVAEVVGEPAALSAVVRAARGGIRVGGDRSRGFGLLELVSVVATSVLETISVRHHRWVEGLAALGVGAAESTGALLAVGPWAVSPDRLERLLGRHGFAILGGVSRRQAHGGFNRAVGRPRTISSHFVPGSVVLVGTVTGDSALPGLETLEASGIGPGRADGWGRLIACHPIHLDCLPRGGA